MNAQPQNITSRPAAYLDRKQGKSFLLETSVSSLSAWVEAKQFQRCFVGSRIFLAFEFPFQGDRYQEVMDRL